MAVNHYTQTDLKITLNKSLKNQRETSIQLSKRHDWPPPRKYKVLVTETLLTALQ